LRNADCYDSGKINQLTDAVFAGRTCHIQDIVICHIVGAAHLVEGSIARQGAGIIRFRLGAAFVARLHSYSSARRWIGKCWMSLEEENGV